MEDLNTKIICAVLTRFLLKHPVACQLAEIHNMQNKYISDKNFRGRTQQDGGLIVDVRVPLQSDHMLEDILKTIFSRLEEKNEKYTVVLLLETPLEWTPRDFIKSLLTVAMEVVLDTKSRATQSICLVSDKSEMLDIVASDVQSTLNHFLEGKTFLCRQSVH